MSKTWQGVSESRPRIERISLNSAREEERVENHCSEFILRTCGWFLMSKDSVDIDENGGPLSALDVYFRVE